MPQQTKNSTENIKHQNIEYLAWDEPVSHIRHLKNTETAYNINGGDVQRKYVERKTSQ